MLEDIQIKNFALINSASVEFQRGFSVLSGETGAGKSILIGAVSFLLGGKSSSDFVRTGASLAQVSGTLYLDRNRKLAESWLEEHGIEIENDRILLRRIIRASGKSSAWLNSVPVTRSELSEFTSWFIDIHGQHEHQSLMQVSQHRRYLDAFAGINDEVRAFTELYKELLEKYTQLKDMNVSAQERAEKIELLKFAIKEISDAKVNPTEDDLLEEEESRLSQFEKLYSNIEEISNMMSGSEDSSTDGIVAILKRANSFLTNSVNMDKTLEPLSARMESLFYEANDIAEELRSYQNKLVFDPSRLQEVQDRSAELFRLKKKYSANPMDSATSLIEYEEKAKEQLEKLESNEMGKTQIMAQIKELERSIYSKAVKISKKRQIAATDMSEQVEDLLKTLGMSGTKFVVRVEQKKAIENEEDTVQSCGQFGIDDIEFMISANPGSPLKPLTKIASGGELSRVMLALKTVLNDTDEVDTLIFDEVDAGIGGAVAVAVGRYLKNLAKNKQILCITHLASVAVYADTQIKIEKYVQNNETSTSVHILDKEERVQEIARMLSGDAINEASLEHARILLQQH
ncbi:MAG: DNA repair protein RecN [Treponema sp. CETP13]|nr:MAG: DNA repair protein RecN [Treponema sp. CETP13]